MENDETIFDKEESHNLFYATWCIRIILNTLRFSNVNRLYFFSKHSN